MFKNFTLGFAPLLAPDGGAAGAGASGSGAPAAAAPAAQGSEGGQSDQAGADSEAFDFDAVLKDPRAKAAYDDRVGKLVSDRLKASRTEQGKLSERIARADQIIAQVASRYEGLDASDYDALRKAIEGDTELLQSEADRRGMTVEQLRQFRQIEQETRQLRQQEIERQRIAKVSAWTEEGRALQAKYPGFDPIVEMQNPQFTAMINSGVSQEDAYLVIHRGEVFPALMAQTAQEVQKATTQSIAAGQRPVEGATSIATPMSATPDLSALRPEDFDAIRVAVERGTPHDKAVEDVLSKRRQK
jgi:hypothetical protein